MTTQPTATTDHRAQLERIVGLTKRLQQEAHQQVLAADGKELTGELVARLHGDTQALITVLAHLTEQLALVLLDAEGDQ